MCAPGEPVGCPRLSVLRALGVGVSQLQGGRVRAGLYIVRLLKENTPHVLYVCCMCAVYACAMQVDVCGLDLGVGSELRGPP